MNEQLGGYISSIVAGLITNGIQGIFDYITEETLQDRVINVIETVQILYLVAGTGVSSKRERISSDLARQG